MEEKAPNRKGNIGLKNKNKKMKQYLDLLNDIKENGTFKESRAGDTYSVFGRMLRFDLQEGFPLLTTKKLHVKSIIHELLWFLNGDTNIKYLNDNKVTIWNEWADEDGNLGKIYGYQWTNWDKYYHENEVLIKTNVNQINTIIDQLKNTPDTRRMLVLAWNPAQLDEMNLPPCHYAFQVYSELMKPMERHYAYLKWAKENSINDTGTSNDDAMEHFNFPTRKMSLMFHMRSVDVPLGLPFNIASYAYLTHMLAMVTNHTVCDLVCTLGDTHIYTNQLDGVNEQLPREPRALPKLVINRKVTDIKDFKFEDFELVGYDPHPTIKMPISI